MSCPFAKFATKLPFVPLSGAPHFHHEKQEVLSAMPLSEALRVGTARSHRLVEKSKGVAMILQSSGSHALGPGLHFDRTSYVQWNVMLASIYTALEAALFSSRSHPLLRPLLDDEDLMVLLARTEPLKRDIAAHLAVLHEHTGATLADLAEHARELRQQSTSASVAEDVDCPAARNQLKQHVALAAALLTVSPHPRGSTPHLSADHFDLLTPAQTRSTLQYVKRIGELLSPSTSGKAGLLLAHAYTRYLGDLSGGQHIHRKVVKNFPVPSSPGSHLGFEFYHFEAGVDSVDPCQELKRRFRLAMESGFVAYAKGAPLTRISQPLVDEANTAFDLNTALFESLLPAELRMSNAEIAASLDEPTPVVLAKAALRSRPIFPGTLLAAVTIAAMLYLTYSFSHLTRLSS